MDPFRIFGDRAHHQREPVNSILKAVACKLDSFRFETAPTHNCKQRQQLCVVYRRSTRKARKVGRTKIIVGLKQAAWTSLGASAVSGVFMELGIQVQ